MSGHEGMDEPGGSPPCFDTSEQPLEMWAEGYGFGEVPDGVGVFGVVIEVAGEGGTTTFTAFRTGDASMRTSGGRTVTAGTSHERVREAAIALIERAESLIDAFTPADDTPPPPAGTARFYLVTDRGRYFADEPAEALSSATGTLPDLTAAANALLTELRVLDERMQRGGQ